MTQLYFEGILYKFFVYLTFFVEYKGIFHNRPFYSCVLSALAFE